MEEEYIESTALEKAERCSTKEIRDILYGIHISCNTIDKLQRRREGDYEKYKKKLEVGKILENLPKNVNVLYYGKNLFASRAVKDDKIIEIWRKEDLDKYIGVLDKVYKSKTKKKYGSPLKWE